MTLLLYNDHLVNLSRYTDHVVVDVQQGLGGGQQPSPPPPPKDGHPIQEQEQEHHDSRIATFYFFQQLRLGVSLAG